MLGKCKQVLQLALIKLMQVLLMMTGEPHEKNDDIFDDSKLDVILSDIHGDADERTTRNDSTNKLADSHGTLLYFKAGNARGMNYFQRLIASPLIPFGNRIRRWFYGVQIEHSSIIKDSAWFYKPSEIEIHDNVMLDGSGFLVFRGRCWIGSNTRVYSHSHHFSRVLRGLKPLKEPVLHRVVIGDNVFIGDNCLVFKSVPDNMFLPAGTVWK